MDRDRVHRRLAKVAALLRAPSLRDAATARGLLEGIEAFAHAPAMLSSGIQRPARSALG